VAFYSERRAIPELVVHSVKSDGTLGDEIPEERKVKPGVIRDVDFGIMMDPAVAQSLHQWLGEVISEFNKLKEQSGIAASKVKDEPR
jgi:hypothetical protein